MNSKYVISSVALVGLLFRFLKPELIYKPLEPLITGVIFFVIVVLICMAIKEHLDKKFINWNEVDAVVKVSTGKNDGTYDFHEIKNGYRKHIVTQDRFVTLGYTSNDPRIKEVTLEELKKYKVQAS